MDAEDVESSKKKFIDDQIFAMTLAATVQRSNIYKKTEDHKPFQNALRKYLVEYGKLYLTNKVSHDEHRKNIEAFASEVYNDCSQTLEGDKFRIGLAQKALNLYLKYLWCLNPLMPSPPHCPIDAVILKNVNWKLTTWTKIEDPLDYESIIVRVGEEAKAKERNIAEWELSVWNEERQKQSEADCSGRHRSHKSVSLND